jgi:hypothetical protein
MLNHDRTLALRMLGVALTLALTSAPLPVRAAPAEDGEAMDVAPTSPVIAMESGISAASPVPATLRLISGYGVRRGRTGAQTFHAGVDFAAPAGTEVFGAADGVVLRVARDSDHGHAFSGYGNAIVIHHPALGVCTLYAHLSAIDVEEGQHVVAGASIGRTGATTNGRFPGMGAHLHFEVRRDRSDGSATFPGAYARWNLDPQEWLAERGVGYGQGGAIALHAEIEVVAQADVPSTTTRSTGVRFDDRATGGASRTRAPSPARPQSTRLRFASWRGRRRARPSHATKAGALRERGRALSDPTRGR